MTENGTVYMKPYPLPISATLASSTEGCSLASLPGLRGLSGITIFPMVRTFELQQAWCASWLIHSVSVVCNGRLILAPSLFDLDVPNLTFPFTFLCRGCDSPRGLLWVPPSGVAGPPWGGGDPRHHVGRKCAHHERPCAALLQWEPLPSAQVRETKTVTRTVNPMTQTYQPMYPDPYPTTW
eukprot:6460935-Pyramimonas_sp.AAC.1